MRPLRTIAALTQAVAAMLPMAFTAGIAMTDVAGAQTLRPVSFADIPGWLEDNQHQALLAFSRSCEGPPPAIRQDWDAHRLAEESRGVETGGFEPRPELRAVCLAWRAQKSSTDDDARALFERHFVPHEVVPADGQRKVTGYFEPLLPGSRERTERFRYPLYEKPDGLVALNNSNRPRGFSADIQAALQTTEGLIVPPDRRAIEQGDHDLDLTPLVWLDDPVELYFVHIQGSARIALQDETTMRLGYAGKNGHPYASIGREIVRRELMALETITAESLKDWLRDNPELAAEIFPVNPSYIFFREIRGLAEEGGPIGAEGIPLTEGRTLAVDPRFHRYGTPVFVSADLPMLPAGDVRPFRRLMIAQDTGSAIRGPVRGDIFAGTGAEAGLWAGMINHPARFFVLLPRDPG
ncbi:MAG: MltA domain-containing protein [Pseudomonadota bacterium]